MEQQKKQELITLGWLLIIIGIILLIFGFGSEGWVRNQAMNSIFTGYNSYQFWLNVNSFRELCQPLSIVLIIGGGILLYSQSLRSSKNNSIKKDEPLKLEKMRYEQVDSKNQQKEEKHIVGTESQQQREKINYCFKCGVKLEGNPNYCYECGTKLR